MTMGKEEIAIIGMAGRFPKASNVDEYWDNLRKGRDCVEEIPEIRFHIDDFYDFDIKKKNKTYCRWMGTVPNADLFDEKFFNISPAEALLMDPQQRLFLEESYHALEDAGYAGELIKNVECGVFVGVGSSDYMGKIRQEDCELNTQLLLGSQSSIIPARIAYFLDLKGPNMPIDTACSSSLVAIHQACNAIRAGECGMAIAGGACILTTPDLFIMTSKSEMLSKSGRCKTFDDNADGFVPSESVGAIILKPLNAALQDNDYIYGIIRGSRVNQDGKTNGITAPSGDSQYKLETELYDLYHINPEEISYIETHGTGTKLGDPIEVSALKRAFEKYTDKKNFCALGSVKTNIGHALPAAGIASIIKVLLCMKHGELVPTLHYEHLNEHIDLEDSPFYVNKEVKEWNTTGKRTAAVSAFGLSGTNCHLVVEEPERIENKKRKLQTPWHMIALSAKTEKNLKCRVHELLAWMEQAKTDLSMDDVEYTLLAGRGHFRMRLAFIAANKKETIRILHEIAKGDMYSCFTSKNKEADVSNINQKDIEARLSADLNDNGYKEELTKIALLYTAGKLSEFSTLFGGRKHHIVSLPGYPFAGNSYWNVKKEQKDYEKIFSCNDYFIRDHIIDDRMMVPGAAQIEMMSDAFEDRMGYRPTVLEYLYFLKGICVNEQEQTIKASIEDMGEELKISLISPVDGNCSQAVFPKTKKPLKIGTIALQDITIRCPVKKDIDACYELYDSANIHQGKSMRTIKELMVGNHEALAIIEEAIAHQDRKIDPAILDGALQTVIAFESKGENRIFVPYTIGCMQIMNNINHRCVVHIVREEKSCSENERAYDIEITDEKGEMIARINDYRARRLEDKSCVFFRKNRLLCNLDDGEKTNERGIILFDYDDTHMEQMKKVFSKVILITIGKAYQKLAEDRYQINPLEEEEHTRLIMDLKEQKSDITDMVYLWTTINKEVFQSNPHEIIKYGFQSFLSLVRALIRSHLKIKKRILYLYETVDNLNDSYNEAYGAFARTVYEENPNLLVKVVGFRKRDGICEIAKKELSVSHEEGVFHVWHEEKNRYVEHLEEVKMLDSSRISWRNGVYVITGGAGGLGKVFAAYIMTRIKRGTIILIGRSEQNDRISSFLDQNQTSQVKTIYLMGDICKEEDVRRMVNDIHVRYGTINGVIHSAGVIHDQYIRNKTDEQALTVIEPKIIGTLNLDEYTKEDRMDFFVTFSAVAAMTGNVGQCDYAFGNSFMDSFIKYRSTQVKDKKRFGKSISINWPLWDCGGMDADNNTRKYLQEKVGMEALDGKNGIHAFEKIFLGDDGQTAVIYGNRVQIRRKLFGIENIKKEYEEQGDKKIMVDDDRKSKVEKILRRIFAETLSFNAEDFELDEAFEEYGVDSVMIVNLNTALEKYFGKVSKTLLFEYQNMGSLVEYFTENYGSELKQIWAEEEKEETYNDKQGEQVSCFEKDQKVTLPVRESEMADNVDIAIIGMNGRYPMAGDVYELWENLVQGKDCITEIPADRWEWQKYYSKENGNGKSNCKWGGFIEDIDKFDALFFNISPKEAELMDPQERLFLETAWGTIEDAGYRKKDISRKMVGVYVGSMGSQYQLVGAESTQDGHAVSTASAYASIANRVSYFFDFHGPSITLDTMCSSALSAIHMACQAIKNGECEMALAGGVNLIIHPDKYVMLGQGNFTSSDGRCHSFGEGGNGYVPGEGVGAILLKRLDQAIEDKDNIYAVIKGSAMNHGGKTNGYTVPNPVMQAQVIETALKNAKVNPETIRYIETHATGTALGDPIEISGIANAFSKWTEKKQYCSIGSIKSNIGHLEGAAGIAAVTKVLLQMKNKMLVPSINSAELNKYIYFEDSPVYVQHALERWETNDNLPIRAGVSAFGAGGSNVHMILEEAAEPDETDETGIDYLFAISAENKEKLMNYCKKYIKFFTEEDKTVPTKQFSCKQLPWKRITYTMQNGRVEMEERLAFVIKDKADCVQKLNSYITGENLVGLYETNHKEKEYSEKNIQGYIKHHDMEHLAEAWVNHARVDWSLLYTDKPTKISLPTYPFKRKRHWVGGFDKTEPQKIVQSLKKTEDMNIAALIPSISIDGDTDVVKLEYKNDGIAFITISDIKNTNMLTNEVLMGLDLRLRQINANEQVKVVIVTGTDHVFCMGGTQQQLMDIAEGRCRFIDSPIVFRGFLECRVPVISAMQGHAMGGGFIFGLYGDVVILSEESIYSAVFMKYGFTPGMGATYILKEKLGTNLAMELMLSARDYTGRELKNRGANLLIVPQDQVLSEAIKIAENVTRSSMVAIQLLKKNSSEKMLKQVLNSIEEEVQMHDISFVQPEVKEKIKYYYAKKPKLQAEIKINQDDKTVIPKEVINQNHTRAGNIEEIKQIIRNILHLDNDEISLDMNFRDMGVDSISSVEIIRDINNQYGLSLEAVTLYDYPSINELSEYVLSMIIKKSGNEDEIKEDKEDKIEIIDISSENPIEVKFRAVNGNVNIIAKIRIIVANILHLEQDEFDNLTNFKDLGIDSISSVEVIRDINQEFSLNLDAVILYDYPNINELSSMISEKVSLPATKCTGAIKTDFTNEIKVRNLACVRLNEGEKKEVDRTNNREVNALASDCKEHTVNEKKTVNLQLISNRRSSDIAIVGISCRYPGASNVKQYWKNIMNKTVHMSNVPEDRMQLYKKFEKEIQNINLNQLKGGFLDDVDLFDPYYFNCTPKEAIVMDPQQRLFLEEAIKAFEDAGFSDKYISNKKCGVFVGASSGDYAKIVSMKNENSVYSFTGLSPSVLAGRLSYHLNLLGPSIAIDTACSSSLVAIHEACSSIRNEDCEMAVAGGVMLMLTPELFAKTGQVGMLSPNGTCYPFDRRADGIVISEGIGVVVLKPFDKAIQDRDYIYGVIKGSGVNQDGRTNGLTAPSAKSQAKLEREIYDRYHIMPSNISYVETHGTGTKLGDPIEFKALKESFEAYTDQKQFCALGSVKGSIGHTLMASGVASVIKVLLAMKYKKLPAMAGFMEENEHINLKDSPFYIPTETKDWVTKANQKRLAAVSAFGFSGTNCHIVIEEPPIRK